jgi:predicted nucleic acid-binding protein
VTFVDTGFLFALMSTRDEHHERVVEVFRTFKESRLADSLLTTNHVVAETITLARKIGHLEATTLGESLYAEKLARIHWATPDEERAAFNYFKQHQDQTYSVTDCLSFVVMEKDSTSATRWPSTPISLTDSSRALDRNGAEEGPARH